MGKDVLSPSLRRSLSEVNMVDPSGLQVSWVRLGSAAKFRDSKVRMGADDRVDFDRNTRKWVTVSDEVVRFASSTQTSAVPPAYDVRLVEGLV